MKILLTILILTSFISFGQVLTPEYDKSITLTPQGIRGGGYAWMTKRNVALGYGVSSRIWGQENVLIGLDSNSTFYSGNGGGNRNILIGNGTLAFVNNAYSNVAIGVGAGGNLHYGEGNVFIGDMANIHSPSKNTYSKVVVIGSYAWSNKENSVVIGSGAQAYGSNSVAVGFGAVADAFDGNMVRIGNASITKIEGAVPWSTPSDRSLKQNIKYNSSLGLSFITKLKPASYYYTADKTKLRHDGFIAQDVERVMRELRVEFSGLQRSADGTYSLAYSDFVMPLVNAVKEQQKQIEDLKKEVAALKELKKQVDALVKAGALKQ